MQFAQNKGDREVKNDRRFCRGVNSRSRNRVDKTTFEKRRKALSGCTAPSVEALNLRLVESIFLKAQMGRMKSKDLIHRQSFLCALNTLVSALVPRALSFFGISTYNRENLVTTIKRYNTIQAFWSIQRFIASSMAILMLPFFIPNRVFTSFLNCLSNSSSIVRMSLAIHYSRYLCIYKLNCLCNRYLS